LMVSWGCLMSDDSAQSCATFVLVDRQRAMW
jgi:hypothetical protein